MEEKDFFFFFFFGTIEETVRGVYFKCGYMRIFSVCIIYRAGIDFESFQS